MEMPMVLTVVIYQGQIKTAPHTIMSPFSSSAGSIVTISRLLPEPCRSLQKKHTQFAKILFKLDL